MPDSKALSGQKKIKMIRGSDLITYGSEFLGRPYVWGATGPNSFDCSGFTSYVYHHFGLPLPRTTYEQVKIGTHVDRKNVQVGDLIFSNWTGKAHSHVGIYAGNNKVLHAGKPVQFRDLDDFYWSHVDEIRRHPQVSTTADPLAAGALGAGVATDALDAASGTAGLAGALGGIAEQMQGVAAGLASVGQVAEWLLKLALPSNMIRLVTGVFGAVFIAFGLFFLLREVRRA